MLGRVSLAQHPECYVSFTQAKQQIQQRGQPLNTLEQFNDKTKVQAVLQQYPQASAWVPLKSNSVDMTVLLDQSTQVIKIVD
jgi:hypothetical protein